MHAHDYSLDDPRPRLGRETLRPRHLEHAGLQGLHGDRGVGQIRGGRGCHGAEGRRAQQQSWRAWRAGGRQPASQSTKSGVCHTSKVYLVKTWTEKRQKPSETRMQLQPAALEREMIGVATCHRESSLRKLIVTNASAEDNARDHGVRNLSVYNPHPL